jgi:hypothetical protein
MPNWVPLEVAISIILIYFILSVIASAINELIATVLGWRATNLERWLKKVLSETGEGPPPETGDAEKRQAPVHGRHTAAHAAGVPTHTDVTTFLDHALVKTFRPTKRTLLSRLKLGSRGRPAYLASTVFASAVLSFGGKDPAGETAEDALQAALANLPSDYLRQVAKSLMVGTERTVDDLRGKLEQWYDDSMERVSGWYRRKVQVLLLAIGLAIAVALNVDTLLLAQRLWTDQTVRAGVIAQVDKVTERPPSDFNAAADNFASIKALDIPLGWKLGRDAAGNYDPRDLPHDARGWVSKLIGILLTTVALSLGAPFWFDLLSRFARIRMSGTPPPVTGGVRTGEGDQVRSGPGLVHPPPTQIPPGQSVVTPSPSP